MTQPEQTTRHFLVLQGLATPFLFRLATRLRGAGHRVTKVQLCGADLLFWPGRALWFRAPPDKWPEFLRSRLHRDQITDLVLFGDCRPYHRLAVALAEERGLAVHVLEEGYVRPRFITLEQGGSNGYSRLPRNPAIILERAAGLALPSRVTAPAGSFATRATWDVLAQIIGLLLTPIFPHYRWHGPVHPFVEYAGWIGRFARAPFRRAAERRTEDELLRAKAAYFLMPLQLDSDYQIRVHSPYRNILAAVDEVLASFGRSAPATHLIVFKLHPLDPGLVPYGQRIRAMARRYGLADRVRIIGDSPLGELITNSSGVVVVNSTVGITALQLGLGVKVLGTALYDIAGLCAAGSLDSFWTATSKPDPTLFDAFLRLLMTETQVEGDFFSSAGVDVASRNAAVRILSRPPDPYSVFSGAPSHKLS